MPVLCEDVKYQMTLVRDFGLLFLRVILPKDYLFAFYHSKFRAVVIIQSEIKSFYIYESALCRIPDGEFTDPLEQNG
jgi:hypothetical protein